MRLPTLFRDRPRPFQIVAGGFVPLLFGGVVGIVLGVSAGGYWGLSALAAIGGVLLAHAIAGTHAKVSLGGFPPLLIVIDAIAGMFLGALGGRIARAVRERSGESLDDEPLADEALLD